ncbi:hypothetical protein KMI_01g01590 [Encephalitozoon hellem]|nr:hypothetical protein KMI_01g01590 [Encephalitozoon hellem]
MNSFRREELLGKGEKLSFTYLLLRLFVIGIGFYRKNLIGSTMTIIRPMCLSLSLTNIYMFIYLENAISRKNLEQCKAYWFIIVMASLEASVVVETIFKFGEKDWEIILFSIVYLGLCLCEFTNIHSICKEFGDMFELFYFRHGGASTKMKVAYKTRARYDAAKFLMILAAIQGVYLQIEGLKHCVDDSVGMARIIVDHLIEVITLFLMLVRQNEEDEEQRMALIMTVVINIIYSMHLIDKYSSNKKICYDLKRFFIIRNYFEAAINIVFLYYSIMDYRYFGFGLKEVFFPTNRRRRPLSMRI